MRLDVYLVEKGYAHSRRNAQDLIQAGCVYANGDPVYKSSFLIKETISIDVQPYSYDFASRGGIKLFEAIKQFGISLTNRIVLDVGASTGGFSDVCLQQGATYVYALDVGHDQLAAHLRADDRVKNLEGINARYIDRSLFETPFDFVCMDVSFISIKLLFDNILEISDNPLTCVILVKPQFEVGKEYIKKNGIVKDKKIHERLLKDFIEYFDKRNMGVLHISKSIIKGRGGNQEYLFHLQRDVASKAFDIKAIVE